MGVRVQAKSTRTFGVGEVARRFGVTTNVLRFWEDFGLLGPDRDVAGRRRYTDNDLLAIAFIVQAKELGFELRAVRDLLTTSGPDRQRLFGRHVDELDAKIDRLRRAREVVAGGLDCPHDDFLDCPVFQKQLAGRVPPEAP